MLFPASCLASIEENTALKAILLKLMILFVVFIDRVPRHIIHLVASVCESVRLSVGALLFEPFDFDFGMRVDLDLG